MKFLFEVIFPKKKFGPLIVDVEDDFIGKNSIFISFSDVDNQDLRISEFFHYIFDSVDIFPAKIILDEIKNKKLTGISWKLNFARPISAYISDSQDGNIKKLATSWEFKNLETSIFVKNDNFVKNIVKIINRLF